MSIDPTATGPADGQFAALSVEEMESVNGGSFGGLVEGIGKFVAGDVGTVMSIAGAPESGGTSLIGAPMSIDELVDGANEITNNV